VKLWCEFAWLGGARADADVLIEVDGDRITTVQTGVSMPPAKVADALYGLTLPGFANAHSHAFQRALRGRAQDAGGGSFWTWREQMYELATTLDPDSYLRLARATYGEMALAGITAVGEFHYLHHGPDGTPYEDPNAMGTALIEAAADAGVRLTLINTCYLHGGFGEPLEGAQRRFGDADADAWAARADALLAVADDADAAGGGSARVRVSAAIHSVRAVDPDSARVVAEWASARNAPLHAHVSEQPAENEACIAALGVTPMRLLADAGALGERFTAVHATHLTDEDIGLLAGGTVCLCPTTERDLADGIGPARALREAGASLALGSDSHAIIDPLEEARAVELDERLATGVRGNHSAADLLRAATEAGYRCLGWPDGGQIEAGSLADLVTVSLGSVRLAGTSPEHALESVVFAGSAADVTHVLAAGRFIVRGGVHHRIDVARELEATIQ
jgi:formiminoglutamate deiminase